MRIWLLIPIVFVLGLLSHEVVHVIQIYLDQVVSFQGFEIGFSRVSIVLAWEPGVTLEEMESYRPFGWWSEVPAYVVSFIVVLNMLFVGGGSEGG